MHHRPSAFAESLVWSAQEVQAPVHIWEDVD